MCPLGLSGSAPAGMLQENCSETFSVSPPHAWSLDHLHSVTFSEAPLYFSSRAMWLSLYTAPVCATPAHTCPALCAPLVNSDVFFTPSAACKHFGLLTVFFHLWEATATSQACSVSLTFLPRRKSGTPTPIPPLFAKQKKRALQTLFLKWRPEWVISEWTGHPQRCSPPQGGDQLAAAAGSEGWSWMRFLT